MTSNLGQLCTRHYRIDRVHVGSEYDPSFLGESPWLRSSFPIIDDFSWFNSLSFCCHLIGWEHLRFHPWESQNPKISHISWNPLFFVGKTHEKNLWFSSSFYQPNPLRFYCPRPRGPRGLSIFHPRQSGQAPTRMVSLAGIDGCSFNGYLGWH